MYDTQNTANFKKYLKYELCAQFFAYIRPSLSHWSGSHYFNDEGKIRRLNGCEKQEDPREEAKFKKTSLLHTN